MSRGMLGGTDLRLTVHALEAAIARDVKLTELEACIANAEQSWSSGKHAGRTVYQRGDLAVVVDEPARTVVTVLYRDHEQWTSSQGRPSGKVLSGTQRRRMTALLTRMRAEIAAARAAHARQEGLATA